MNENQLYTKHELVFKWNVGISKLESILSFLKNELKPNTDKARYRYCYNDCLIIKKELDRRNAIHIKAFKEKVPEGYINYPKTIKLYIQPSKIQSVKRYLKNRLKLFKFNGSYYLLESDLDKVKSLSNGVIKEPKEPKERKSYYIPKQKTNNEIVPFDEETYQCYVKYHIKPAESGLFKIIYKVSYDSKNEELLLTKEDLIKKINTDYGN